MGVAQRVGVGRRRAQAFKLGGVLLAQRREVLLPGRGRGGGFARVRLAELLQLRLAAAAAARWASASVLSATSAPAASVRAASSSWAASLRAASSACAWVRRSSATAASCSCASAARSAAASPLVASTSRARADRSEAIFASRWLSWSVRRSRSEVNASRSDACRAISAFRDATDASCRFWATACWSLTDVSSFLALSAARSASFLDSAWRLSRNDARDDARSAACAS